MAHQYQTEIEEVIKIIRDAKELSALTLKEIPIIANKVTSSLTLLDNFLSHMAGKPLAGDVNGEKKFGPIKIDKKPQKKSAPKIEPTAAEFSKKNFKNEVKESVKKILPTFMIRPSEELLDSLSDPEVRMIAAWAKMEITETKPEKITVQFIDEIKKKIKKNQELKAANKSGQKPSLEAEN